MNPSGLFSFLFLLSIQKMFFLSHKWSIHRIEWVKYTFFSDPILMKAKLIRDWFPDWNGGTICGSHAHLNRKKRDREEKDRK